MPADISELFWTVAGFAMLGISVYMIGTRIVMPRFGSPWMSRRQRESALERGQATLASVELDDETRYQLQSRINSLRARGARGESWGATTSERDICREIREICDRHESDRHS